MLRVTYEIKSIKAGEDNTVWIEGWANYNSVDDVGDRMIFSGVDLERYKRNPMLLFNHDRNLPIGQTEEIRVTDDGLWVKARISGSKDRVVSYVRDLVREGILKTFSIGFEPKEEQMKDGVNEISKWRLNEISIVTLPANIDAEFSLVKSLKKAKNYVEAKAMVIKAIEGEGNNPPPAEASPPEGEPKVEEIKGKFEDCVANKIPKLIEEGRPQDQAIAIAFSMCSQEGKCGVELMTSEMFAKASEIAAACKPDEQKAIPGQEATPLPQPSDDPSNYGSPHLELAKSQLALLGRISEQLAAIMELLAKDVEAEDNGEEMSPPPPPPAQPAAQAEASKDAEEVERIKQRIAAVVKELGL